MFLRETRQTPVVDSFDVAVCGGGIAGIAAALAATRAGKRTILLERQYLLGGLATAGIVTIYLPLCDGMGRQVSFGLAEELLRLSIRDGAEARYPKNWLDGVGACDAKSHRFEVQFNPQLFAIAAEELLLAEGVTLAYGAYAVGVAREDTRVTHLITESKSGRRAYAVGAIVDATGDADVAAYADAPTREYSMGNFVAGWYYSVGADGYHLRFVGSSASDAAGTTGKRLLGLSTEEGTAFTVRSHQATYRDVCERRKSDPTLLPVTMPTVPQLRMTRRLVGRSALSLADVHTFCADSIGMVSDWRERGPVYEVPFGSLCSETVENLFCAGRCVSVDDALWDMMRVIPCCAVTGEAAGLAAALYAENRLSLPILQESLRKNGVILHENELKERL